MRFATTAVVLGAVAVSAHPFNLFAKKANITAGATSTDLYPPSALRSPENLRSDTPVLRRPVPNLSLLVGSYIQAELTIATAAAYPNLNGPFFPLVGAQPSGDVPSNFSIFKNWGNLSPAYSVNSSFYGLPKASPLLPDGCEITQVHILYRHGARYPTSGSLPTTFAAKVYNASVAGNLTATGPLAFLQNWQYSLGAELLTPFGRLQNFAQGVEARQLYGKLLNNFTSTNSIPVFRTESQDRMVKTAENFAAGFFGVPEYLQQVNIEIVVEASGFNNTGAPYETCTNSNVASRGSIGSTASLSFAATAFQSTVSRIQPSLTPSVIPSPLISPVAFPTTISDK